MAEEKLSLAQKLGKAAYEIGTVQKDSHNKSQGWGFISESAIKAGVRKAEGKYGFIIVPSKIINIEKTERRTKSGGIYTFYDVTQQFTITDGNETIVAQAVGTGSDMGDKAINKACTIALKNLEKQIFNVSDTEDPDAETVQPVASTKQSKPLKTEYTIKFDGQEIPMTNLVKGVKDKNEKAIKFSQTLTGRDKLVFDKLMKG